MKFTYKDLVRAYLENCTLRHNNCGNCKMSVLNLLACWLENKLVKTKALLSDNDYSYSEFLKEGVKTPEVIKFIEDIHFLKDMNEDKLSNTTEANSVVENRS